MCISVYFSAKLSKIKESDSRTIHVYLQIKDLLTIKLFAWTFYENLALINARIVLPTLNYF